MKTDIKVVQKLFNNAKVYDQYSEWEFIQTIMNGKYFDNMYELDDVLNNDDLLEKICRNGLHDKFVLQESKEFLGLIEYISDNIEPSKKVARLMLMLYCHITEMDEFYNTIINLLWISNGFRFYPNPLSVEVLKKNLSDDELKKLKIQRNDKSLTKPVSKVELIVILSKKAKVNEIGNLFSDLIDNSLRNSFYHSSYIFNINKFVAFDLNGKYKAYTTKEVMDKIKNTKELMEFIFQLVYENKTSYNTTLKIKGRKINYLKNNLELKSEEKIVDCTICGKEGVGIVTTMQSYSDKENACGNDDPVKDDFMEKFIEFCSNPDNYIEKEEE